MRYIENEPNYQNILTLCEYMYLKNNYKQWEFTYIFVSSALIFSVSNASLKIQN